MRKLLKLSAIFLEHASVRVEVPEDPNELEALLLRAYQAGRDRWPNVLLPEEEFIRHWTQRLPAEFEGLPLAQVIEETVLPDLYLACACLRDDDDSEALAVFEEQYIARLPALLGKPKLPEDVLDELKQTVRIQVLVGTGGSKPDLDRYRGLGTLESWIKIVASRQLGKQSTPTRFAHEEDAHAMLEALPAPEDPYFDTLKRRYFPQLVQALGEAFSSLSPDQRHLLRLHFRSRLSTTKIAALLGVNQSTSWRQIAKALEAVYAEMKRRLQERYNLSTHDFESLVNALRSQLDMSISQLLGKNDAEDDDGEEKEKEKEDKEEEEKE
ncbi:sigma factor-like helix-turn-helix DNA-binding protein [Hyalangium sp.]|uniref:sigma factor-like helix-turn-helix DNA-binding protein n=1 Tax=Hyalangium sp. TaxID=2028555 RepID=UPI002D5A8149|nr:sigma factor-like helix-turn-helix DNA-binding protein [Hyalangium sp.]HYH97163.1 sigma factor-like helix-turn-helix DNA-binding protein [Hyalangium sp.]